MSWLTISDYNRSELAKELGVSSGRISQLLTSREEPSAHLIAKLMMITSLPFDRLFKIVRDILPAPDHHPARSHHSARATNKVAVREDSARLIPSSRRKAVYQS